MTTSYQLCFSGIISIYNCEVSLLKHVTPKSTSLGISEMWSTIFSPSKLTEILEKFVNIPVN